MDNAENNTNPGTKQIANATFSVDIFWDKERQPVIYCVGHGSSTSPREAL